MSNNDYDAIVVGARCAGSPTAMLLARKGYKVLLVDRATFPSDTISTHFMHPPAVAAMERWGLLDRLTATGCPPVDTYSFDFGHFTISGACGTAESPVGYSPRRIILDNLLVEAAGEAGAEVREGFTVEEVLFDDGRVAGIRGHGKDGKSVTEHARVVIGADGRHSRVAEAVGPEQYNEKPIALAMYYTYWSGLPVEGFEITMRPERGWAMMPTHDDLTLLGMGWPYAEFDANKKDVEGNYLKTLELAPEVAERVRSAKREAKFVGAALPGFFRKPFGPGWALVGDAGYNKDPITAMGILDAFRDVELCVTALDESFSGTRSFDEAMGDYHRIRDEHAMPMYEMTFQFASFEDPPPEQQQLLGAIAQNQDSMDDFVRVQSGVISPPEFFSEENVGRIMARAAASVAS